MDPITAVGFIAAVIQLINVITKAVMYMNDVKDASKDRAQLTREAITLLSLFNDLRSQAEETDSTDPWFRDLRSLGGKGGPLEDFTNTMKNLVNKLAPATGIRKASRTLSWTLSKKEIHTILAKIERFKSLVGIALQKDHL